MELSTGQKVKLADLTSSRTLAVDVALDHPDVDLAVFGLDGERQLRDDRYFVFYNQPASPEGALRATKTGGGVRFELDLAALPPSVERLVFTATSDSAPISAMRRGEVGVGDGAAVRARYPLAAAGQEKALMLLELYRHGGDWRVAAVGQGFNGGLRALLEHFGGEAVEDAPAPPPPPPTPAAPLSKVDLRKAQVGEVLERGGIGHVRARVMIVMDASGSMSALYSRGTVQETLERLVPVALRLDDDGQAEFWFYASSFKYMGAVGEASMPGFVGHTLAHAAAIGYGNNEPPVMQDVLARHRGQAVGGAAGRALGAIGGALGALTGNRRGRATDAPTLVLFITDGGIDSATSAKIGDIIRESAREPLFWQFVGLGNANYGILRDLDTLTGRAIDNSGFFAVDDIDRVSDEELYRRVLTDFATWHRAWQALA